MNGQSLTAQIHREGAIYVADCPEIGTVSQGYSIEEAIANLTEATDLFLEDRPGAPSVGTFRVRVIAAYALEEPL